MENAFLTALILSALVTICVRAIPIVLLSQMRLPSLVYNWLGFIPAAIMAAIIAAELTASPAYTTNGWSTSAIAAMASLAIGVFTRSLVWTVLTGIAAFIALQLIL